MGILHKQLHLLLLLCCFCCADSLVFIDSDNKPQWAVDAGGKVPMWRPSRDKLIPDSDVIVELLEKVGGSSIRPCQLQLLSRGHACRGCRSTQSPA